MTDKRYYKIILTFLQLVVGLNGFAGGIGLIADPSGGSVGLTIELLSGSIFVNFLIPGVLLFIINGMGNLTGACLTIIKNPLYAKAAMALGVILVIWIIGQIITIGFSHWLHLLFLLFGILEFILGYLLRRDF